MDLPGGDPEKMWHSLNWKLKSLDDDIILYPGHHYGKRSVSTMGEQKRNNPYMRFANLEAFMVAMGVA